MARYIDGCVLPLPKKNLKAYALMAYGGFKAIVEA